MSSKLNSSRWNFIALSIAVVLGTVLLYFSSYVSNPENSSRQSVIWVPFILGIVIATIYGISRLVGQRYNWIITLLGILMILYISIPVFFAV